MVTEFAILVLHTQLHVATPAGAVVGLQWTDDEVAQGFAWDEAVVAFGVPDHDGECLVRVETAPAGERRVAEDALWAIAVPFTATGRAISVGSIVGEREIPIVPGRYELVFQARSSVSNHAYRLDVTFTLHASPEFAILKQGELESGQILRRQAQRI